MPSARPRAAALSPATLSGGAGYPTTCASCRRARSDVLRAARRTASAPAGASAHPGAGPRRFSGCWGARAGPVHASRLHRIAAALLRGCRSPRFSYRMMQSLRSAPYSLGATCTTTCSCSLLARTRPGPVLPSRGLRRARGHRQWLRHVAFRPDRRHAMEVSVALTAPGGHRRRAVVGRSPAPGGWGRSGLTSVGVYSVSRRTVNRRSSVAPSRAAPRSSIFSSFRCAPACLQRRVHPVAPRRNVRSTAAVRRVTLAFHNRVRPAGRSCGHRARTPASSAQAAGRAGRALRPAPHGAHATPTTKRARRGRGTVPVEVPASLVTRDAPQPGRRPVPCARRRQAARSCRPRPGSRSSPAQFGLLFQPTSVPARFTRCAATSASWLAVPTRTGRSARHPDRMLAYSGPLRSLRCLNSSPRGGCARPGSRFAEHLRNPAGGLGHGGSPDRIRKPSGVLV